MRLSVAALALGSVLLSATGAAAQTALAPITYAQAVERARQRSPELAAVRGREAVAGAEVGIAGEYPNPSLVVGTATETARLSAGVSVPLVVFGQRGASEAASRADLATVRVETEVASSDIRAAAAHAFVQLWLATHRAGELDAAARLAQRVEDAVSQRVQLGSAPEIERLRAHAVRLRADAEATTAAVLVGAAGSELGHWLGMADGVSLRPQGDPAVPLQPPALSALLARVKSSPVVRREEADARAAAARADRERAARRPLLTLDVGLDAYDPTLPRTNYRAQLAIEVPVFSQRGPQVERETQAAGAAQLRAAAARSRLRAGLLAGYRRLQAVSVQVKALAQGVVPASDMAAVAAEQAYQLGRLPLIEVLAAAQERIDSRIGLLEARAARADAWIEVQLAAGGPW